MSEPKMSLEDENDLLRRAYDLLNAEKKFFERKYHEAEARLVRVLKYAGHLSSCGLRVNRYAEECSCGFADL